MIRKEIIENQAEKINIHDWKSKVVLNCQIKVKVVCSILVALTWKG
jgi:hypothetical protein